eukprot:g2884.t1
MVDSNVLLRFPLAKDSLQVFWPFLQQSRFEELVASTLEAKAAAPCKALKRRVCQRARKKLAHMLPQEEFEKVVARLKGDDLEAGPEHTAVKEEAKGAA